MLMTWKDGRGFFPTQVGDEFLGDVHPAQQLLQEAEGKSFFNGGCVQFHVLKTPLWRGRDSQLRHRPYPTSHTFLVSLCTLPTCRSFLHRPLPHLRLFSESCFPMLLPLGLIGALPLAYLLALTSLPVGSPLAAFRSTLSLAFS